MWLVITITIAITKHIGQASLIVSSIENLHFPFFESFFSKYETNVYTNNTIKYSTINSIIKFKIFMINLLKYKYTTHSYYFLIKLQHLWKCTKFS